MVISSNTIKGLGLDPDTEQIINPTGVPQVTQGLSENVVLTTLDDLYNWARLSSLSASPLWNCLLFHRICCSYWFTV